MPDMIPVGNTNYVPPPDSGLNTLSSILGIRQRKQALISGGLDIQRQQADLVPAQQKAQETQAGAQLLADPIGNGITDQDGNVLPNAHVKILQAMPTTGSEKYDQLVKAATGNVQYKNAWLKLRSDVRQDVSARLQGTSVDPNSGMPEIHDTLEAIKSDYAGTPAAADINKIVGVSKGAIDDAASSHGLPGAKNVISHFSTGGLANTQLSGPGGLATPDSTTNAAGQILNRNRPTGALSAPPGAPPGGPLNPSSPQVAGAASRQTGTAGSDIERSNQVSAAVAPANQTITITQEIDDLADQVHSGKVSQAISKAAAAVGMDSSTYARQLLEKDLGRLKASATSGAQSDQRQATVLSGFPDATSDNQTIHTAMDYTRGIARQDLARSKLLNSVKTKDPTLQGFQHADDLLTGNTDPLMHEFNALKTPQDRIGFYKRNFTDPQKAKEFRDKVAGMGHAFGQ